MDRAEIAMELTKTLIEKTMVVSANTTEQRAAAVATLAQATGEAYRIIYVAVVSAVKEGPSRASAPVTRSAG